MSKCCVLSFGELFGWYRGFKGEISPRITSIMVWHKNNFLRNGTIFRVILKSIMVKFTSIMCLTLALTQRDDSRNNISYIAKNDLVVDGREVVITCGSMFVSVSISVQIPQKERKKGKTFRKRLPRHVLQYNLILLLKTFRRITKTWELKEKCGM